ncbi:MAG: metallophosphoesterase [Sedimentibacter sp.]
MKKIFSSLSIIFLIALVFYIYARFVEPNSLKVHYENIKNSTINRESSSLKLLQFSDMHVSEFFDEKDIKHVVQKISEEKPDIVVFTGDLFEEYSSYENKDSINKIWEALGEINASIGKFAIYGNHDYGGGAEQIYKEIMENSGFVILKNEKIALDEYNVSIIGMDDSIFGKYEKSKLVELLDEESFNIVLSHEPDVIDFLLEYNIDLFLSGHSHGGQVNLPLVNSLPLLAKKYTGGIYSFNNYRNTTLYVNVGLGTSKLPLRFMAPPELSVFVLNNQ